MKHLLDYIFEALSDESIEKLNDAGVTDDNVEDIVKIIKKHTKSQLNDETLQKYKKFFENHGLWNLNWGRNNSAVKAFINLFAENDKVDLLTQIIVNDVDGNTDAEPNTISVHKLGEKGNIFDYCKGWTDEAKIIATWVNSRSAAAGPCELLLKFILKESEEGKSGDVSLHVEESDHSEEMEVKATTLNKSKSGKNETGGHAAGQKGGIKLPEEIYKYLNKNLFEIEDDKPENLTYFQKESGVNTFNELIKSKNIDIEKLSTGLVDALWYQYNIENNANIIDVNIKKAKENLYKAVQDIINKLGVYKDAFEGFKSQQLYNIVGCVQLYLYSLIEGFDYLFVVYMDKTIEIDEPQSKLDNSKVESNHGKYFCVKDCNVEKSPLLDFENILGNLKFKALENTNHGRAGKIILINQK